MITVAFFKKKNKQEDEVEKVKSEEELAQEAEKEARHDTKLMVLEKLNEKLKGTLYDECIIMPKGFTIDVQIGRKEIKDEIHLLQVIYVIKNDLFDEPLIDPVDSQGQSEEEAAQMAVEIFFGGVWHPLNQSMTKTNPQHISVDFLRQHYDFDMYCQSVVRIGVKDKKPVMVMNYLMDELPKYLGSKKYYWVRVYLAKFKDKKMLEVRINGSVCPQLTDKLKPYIEQWEESDNFVCEKQYAIFVNRADDECPFKKELVMDSARQAIDMMTKITNREEYIAMSKKLEELTGNASLASEIRIFIPEIFAKLTLGYREGDSLFLIEGDGEDQSQIEFKKTQLRSYFYLQQAILEYLSTNPERENVTRIVTNSVAFREMKKVTDQMKEQGKEIKPADLFVPGTSYKIADADYRVW
jgi:hypothetical protein